MHIVKDFINAMKRTIMLILAVLVFGGYLMKGHPHSVFPPKAAGPIVVQTISNMPDHLPAVKEIDYFETFKDVRNWMGRHGERQGLYRRWSSRFASQGRYSMEVSWELQRWGELVLLDFPQDWRSYNIFAFDVFNPAREPFDLELRIGDQFTDLNFNPSLSRIIAKRTIRPGINRLYFDVTGINSRAKTAWGRKIIHLSTRAKRLLFYVDNMRLER